MEALKETSGRPKTKKPTRGLLIGGIALVTIALLSGSFATGWVASNNALGEISTDPVTTVSVPILDPLGQDRTMPDVRGLDESSAMQALADAGVDVALVTVTTRPAAGLAGIILDQVPAFGTPEPAGISIVVSSSVVVPDIVGAKVEAAVADLTQLGAGVVRQGRYDPSSEVGTVLAVEPAAGSTLPTEVSIVVNVEPSSVFLGNAKVERNRCSERDILVAGNRSAGSLSCSTSQSGSTSTWLLAGAADRFLATVGIPDGEHTSSAATFQVLVDGTPVQSLELVWGQAHKVDLPLTGALRIDLVFSHASNSTEVGLVDPVLLGDPELIAVLRAK